MINDMLVILGKELKEFIFQRGDNRRSGILSLLVVLGLMGIYMPVLSKTEWLTNPLIPLAWSWMPIFLTISMVTDSFAGERERHTLETLLASRLSDQAILFGKIFAAVMYAWGLSLTSLLLGAVTVNVLNWSGKIQFYALLPFVGSMVMMFLAALLMSSVGVLVSLRSSTVRVAYQKMSLTIMGLWIVPMIVLQLLPEDTTARAARSLSGIQVNIPLLVTGAGLLLVAINIIMLAIARARFQRSRLILD
jgi:ABC-2 type transport system permease protein